MPTSTSSKPRDAGERSAHGGGGGNGGEEGCGGGGGGGGRLIKVGFARNMVEAEMLQGLLFDAGIPSILKRSGGFDNPDFLAAGPHDIWANAQQAKEARELLEETLLEDPGEEEAEVLGRASRGGDPMTPERLAIWVTAAVAGAAALIFVLWELT
jgi:Putative prokaryotic signal transducing protein